MTKDPLVQLFLQRSEDAISEAKQLYGNKLRGFALRILGSPEDAEEIENSVYFETWNKIPPAEPVSMESYLFMICRRRSLDKLEERQALKRGGGAIPAPIEELNEALTGEDGRNWAGQISRRDLLERFLKELPKRDREIFLQRYWYFLSTREIAKQQKLKESHVKVLLSRIRKQLKDLLIKEDLWNE